MDCPGCTRTLNSLGNDWRSVKLDRKRKTVVALNPDYYPSKRAGICSKIEDDRGNAAYIVHNEKDSWLIPLIGEEFVWNSDEKPFPQEEIVMSKKMGKLICHQNDPEGWSVFDPIGNYASVLTLCREGQFDPQNFDSLLPLSLDCLT